MKHLFTIIAAVLILSVLIVPEEDAPLSAYFLWVVYAACIIGLVRLIQWRLEDDENANSTDC